MTIEMSEELNELISYSAMNGRICPQPLYWNALYDKLKGTRRVGAAWEPALPLILAAWENTTYLEKKIRFTEHLKWADEHGQIKQIGDYVRNLREQHWFHQAKPIK